MSTLQRALEIATETHQGQLDKAGRLVLLWNSSFCETVTRYMRKSMSAETLASLALSRKTEQ